MKYSSTSHITFILPVVPRSFTCVAINKYPKPINTNPIACLTVEIGSNFFFCNALHSKLKGTASITTNKPLNICTMLGGMCQPRILVSVCCSATKVSEEPDCSKADQKKITKNETM